ncbi:MAG: sulfatase [Flavobacteriales bacterium]|nr:sulfatase [Flavobacteriales bacterium]
MRYIYYLIIMVCISCNPINFSEKPNIILIVADDLGYGDLSIFGNEYISTPNIDKLGHEGIIMTDFHSNGSVCSPTRAALLTGKYQQKVGVPGVITAKNHRDKGLLLNEKTFAEIAKEVGYKTGVFGKWHLGYDPKFSPIKQGFDEFIGFVSGNVDYHSHLDQEGYEDWWKGDTLYPETGYSTDLISKHSVDFIKKNKDENFLLYVAHESPHYPLQGRKSKVIREKGKDFIRGVPENKNEIYKEMIEVMDEGVGEIIKTLIELDLEKKTIIFFFSDNGGTRSGNNGQLRGFKGGLYEGGHRVTSLVWSPSLIKSRQKRNETLMTMDILPTIAEFIGGNIPNDIDGLSFKNHLLVKEKIQARSLFWEYGSNYAVRKNNWKLIITKRKEEPELFDLNNDLTESKDLFNLHPELAKELINEIENWKKNIRI